MNLVGAFSVKSSRTFVQPSSEALNRSLHGRHVYRHESFNQTIFYIYGEFDGWLLGPAPDVNFGGIKNSHDRMCVHTQDAIGRWLLSAH